MIRQSIAVNHASAAILCLHWRTSSVSCKSARYRSWAMGSDTPFVAISHVWGDGLRGTTEKGLPRCQINRLLKMTDWILEDPGRDAGGGAFWIDTLCIPEIDGLREEAIGLMAQTYREAEAVLVIDSGLGDILSSAPPEEKLFHVVFSRWMQRLWTFQEAALAKKVYFEFSDGLVSLVDIACEILYIKEKLIYDFVLIELGSTLVKTLIGLSGNSGFDFSDVLYAVRRRTTSKQSDETLAVCGVLNLDVFELARISDPDKRMETFLLRMGKLLLRQYHRSNWRVETGEAWISVGTQIVRSDEPRSTQTPAHPRIRCHNPRRGRRWREY